MGRGIRLATHGRLGLGSSCLGFKRPCSSGLLLALVLLSIPVASGVVCNTCKDTITGCKGGTDCPLLKTPMENAASLVRWVLIWRLFKPVPFGSLPSQLAPLRLRILGCRPKSCS